MQAVIVGETLLDAGALLSRFLAHVGDAGGVASFAGQVRGGDTQTLTLTRLEPMTTREIEQAVEDAVSRFGLTGAMVRHRVGAMGVGETIVFVATAAPHRRAAFEACDCLMDYLKTRAVFWKQETGAKGARWIEPREQDYQDAQRWENDRWSDA